MFDPSVIPAATDGGLFNPLGVSAGAAMLIPYFLQLVKRLFPTVTDATMDLLMKSLQMVAAIAVAAGIQFAFNSAEGTLVVSGLTMVNLLKFVLQVAAQYKAFEFVYRTGIKPRDAKLGLP